MAPYSTQRLPARSAARRVDSNDRAYAPLVITTRAAAIAYAAGNPMCSLSASSSR